MEKISSINNPARIYLPLLAAAILAGLLLAAGCTAQQEAAGEPAGRVAIGTIAGDPAAYEGKEVVVKGKIKNECGSGCWFILEDESGIIYVDLSPANFAIPQLQGSTVVVRGIVHNAGSDPTIHATTVSTVSRTYP